MLLETSRATSCFVTPGRRAARAKVDLGAGDKRALSRFSRLPGGGCFRWRSGQSPCLRRRGSIQGAWIHPEARLEQDVIVDPGVVIGPRAEIGSGSIVGANSVIGSDVRIGRDCLIGPQATITRALIGNRVILHPGCASVSQVSISWPCRLCPGPARTSLDAGDCHGPEFRTASRSAPVRRWIAAPWEA